MKTKMPETIAPAAKEFIQQRPANVNRLLKAWLSVSDEEKAEFQTIITNASSLSEFERQKMFERIINVHTGPLETKCPFCGRG
jgi:hypothetical protein